MALFDALLPSDFRSIVSPALKRFYLCVLLGCVGTGLTLSMYVIYLHNVRHFPIAFATTLLAGSALLGITTSPLWGTAIDRFGPMWISVIGYFGEGLTLFWWAHVHSERAALVVAVFIAVLGGSTWGPNATMLSRLVPSEQRQRAFGVNFMLVNVGIGLGGLISASVVSLKNPSTFTLLYELNALTMVIGGVVYLSLRGYGHRDPADHHDALKDTEGWKEVLRDKRLVSYFIASVFLMIGGYGSQEAGFSLFVVDRLHISVHSIGLIFAFNTFTIVMSQLWVLNRIQGKSRMGVLFTVGILWAIFWLVLGVSIALPHVVDVITMCAAMALFAVAETMMQPIGGALINDIAPEHLRGRYNSSLGLVWGFAGTLAPLVASLYFSLGAATWWPFGTAAMALLGGWLMLRVRTKLTPSQDGRVPITTTN